NLRQRHSRSALFERNAAQFLRSFIAPSSLQALLPRPERIFPLSGRGLQPEARGSGPQLAVSPAVPIRPCPRLPVHILQPEEKSAVEMRRRLGPSGDFEGAFLRFPTVDKLIASSFKAAHRLPPIVKDASGSIERMVLYAGLRRPFD